MHRRSLLTLLRGFLLSLFVLGGPGLPLVDALVWHRSGVEQLAGSRLEEQGALRIHADACSLAAPLPVPGPLPCQGLPLPAFQAAERVRESQPPAVRVSLALDRGARPRAPPVLSA